jgi:inosine triphosphate pyrophosphatase
MKIKFITGNQGKFEEALHILEGWELEHIKLDLIEIQGTSEEVIRAKAKSALSQLNTPLIVEDVSLCFAALNGMPGPYAKDFLKAMGPAGIQELIEKCEDPSVTAICMVAYIEPGAQPIIFEGRLSGTVVSPAGSSKHGPYSFNTIFKPDGFTHSMGEMSMAEHAKISHRRQAFLKLRNHFETTEAL